MSTETHVFFRGRLPSKAALSRAMKELGFPFAIKPATGSLEQQSGFMPMLLRREETGVEFDVYGDHAAVEEFADAGVDPGFERRASLHWGGDFQEAVAGMCAAAALARLVNGVVFDEAENRLLTVDEAVGVARRNLETLLDAEPVRRPGTRPADIKRYLEPLLEQRGDLALLGRMLLIRPVRHLLRGVLLDRTSDKYTFRVWRYIDPLYAGGDGVGYGDYIRPPLCPVWQPYFEPLLFDTIEDIFDYVGRIRSFEDLARELEGREQAHAIRVMALVLSGQHEHAEKFVSKVERSNPNVGYWRHWAESQRAFIARDIHSVCSKLHAQEAETARKLKLGDIWEPAPFPAEVAEASGAACDEPLFVTTPWIARPPGLVQEVPERPGEIRFAHEALWRKGRAILLVPLTRDQAEERYRTRQHYVLATRLAGGELLVLHHTTHWSPHDPEQPKNPNYVPKRHFCLEVYGSLGRLQALIDEDLDKPGIVRLWQVEIFDRGETGIWLAYNHVRAMEKTIYDHRIDPHGYNKRSMTASDLALAQFPELDFGEFDDLWGRISMYLEIEGFGSFT